MEYAERSSMYAAICGSKHEFTEYVKYLKFKYLGECETKIENILITLSGGQMGSFDQSSWNQKSNANVLLKGPGFDYNFFSFNKLKIGFKHDGVGLWRY